MMPVSKVRLDDLPVVPLQLNSFDPNLPVNIHRDKWDIDPTAGKESMGTLWPARSKEAAVVIVLGEYQKVCPSRELALQSRFFRRHLARYPSPFELHVPKTIPEDGLDAALRFVGTETGVDVTISNLGSVLCTASRLDIPILQRRLEQYLRAVSKLDASYFLLCWEISRYAPASVPMREEMLARGTSIFLDLPEQENWPQLNSRLVRKLFLRPELKSMPATLLFEAALTWIAGNPKAQSADIDRIIAAVPFKRMSEIERFKCLAKADDFKLIKFIAPRVSQVSWHITCVDAGHVSQSDLPESMLSALSVDRSDENAMALPPWDGSKSLSPTTATEMAQLTVSFKSDDNRGDGSGMTTRAVSTEESALAVSKHETVAAAAEREEALSEMFLWKEPRSGGPYRFTSLTTATVKRPDGLFCLYRDEIVMERGSAVMAE